MSELVLYYGYKMRKIISSLLLLTVILTVACSSPIAKIKDSANNYWYYDTRFEEKCPSMDSKVCTELKTQADILKKWNSDLKEAVAAVERGGKLPLQLKQLANTEKKFKAEAKDW